ncbi:MAG: fluoride efflux transporter CrcB [Candidatus Margulisiibacteriota bacterium]
MVALSIFIGGALGAMVRYLFVYFIPLNSLFAVMMVNIIGSFLIGYLAYFQQSPLWLFLAVGFCGSLTTFSTFSMDVVRLISSGFIFKAMLYIALTNGLSVLSCYCGFTLRRLLS